MKQICDLIEKEDTINLKHAYMDACSDKGFHDYVLTFDIEEELLMKYTSSLEDAYLESKNCKKCKNLSTCKNKVSGYCLTPEKTSSNMIIFSYLACKKYEEELAKKRYQQNTRLFNMPTEMKNASFKEIYKDDKMRIPIIKFFKEFMENYQKDKNQKGLYLTGSFGSGKTYLIASLFNEMAKKDIESAMVWYPEFLRNLKSSFQTDYKEKFEYIKKIPLLLLDDIGAENVSNWARDEVLGPLLQYRMEEHLPTFFTSNLTLEELEHSLALTSSGVDLVKARRIIERVKQLSVNMELISKNRRN